MSTSAPATLTGPIGAPPAARPRASLVTGYTLMFSALLLFAGTLSDRIGARRAYRIGMLIFMVASVACGFAPSLSWLIAARVLQGIGAALVTPTSLALIRAVASHASFLTGLHVSRTATAILIVLTAAASLLLRSARH